MFMGIYHTNENGFISIFNDLKKIQKDTIENHQMVHDDRFITMFHYFKDKISLKFIKKLSSAE